MSTPGPTHMPTGSFGHSRRPPRGHMRSGNWSQLPATTMTPAVEKDEHELFESVAHATNGHDDHHEAENFHSHSQSHSPSLISNHNHSHSHNHNHSHGHKHSHSSTGARAESSGDSPVSVSKTSDAYTTPFQGSDNIPLRLVRPSSDQYLLLIFT